jgi:two-component system chemotaxis response regulator CheY
MARKRVLSVGQCAADHATIRRVIEGHFDAAVVSAATFAEALADLRRTPADLVLVNRVLDYDGSEGVDLVGQINADEALRQVPVMLVSNYEDAQEQARGKGARPGFGKSELNRPETVARLRAVLG